MVKPIDWEKESSKSYQDILTVQMAAEYLTVSMDSMYRMIREKTVPFARLNGRIVCRKCDLHEWIGKMVFFPEVKPTVEVEND